MENVYIIEAVRSPIGKRGKGLAGLMPADLLVCLLNAACAVIVIMTTLIFIVVGLLHVFCLLSSIRYSTCSWQINSFVERT